MLVSCDSPFKLNSPLTLDDAVNPLVGLDGDDALVLANVLHDVVDAAYTYIRKGQHRATISKEDQASQPSLELAPHPCPGPLPKSTYI
jgi:hypothetical protein